MSKWIQTKRKASGLSQGETAKSLGISRPTYVRLELGHTKPTETQTAILARLFDMHYEALAEKITEAENEPASDKAEIREIPKENVKKFKEVLLYILGKVGSWPNVGQTVLYKLLYFIDFDYYEKFEKQLIGATYIKNHYGPTPVSFAKIVREMEEDGSMVSVRSKYFEKNQTKYLPVREANVSMLSGQELKHIDKEIERLAHLNASQLTELSHKDTPWRVADDKQVLNYSHVFYRPEETSVREYEPL